MNRVSTKPGAVQSADWGRDVSKRAVYVGRCEPG